MAFRSIMIESPAQLTLRDEQLVIRTDREHTVPMEDISALLLENRRSTITTAALARLGQCGCAVFLCDEKHIPCAVLTPFQQHSRALTVLRNQMEATEPLKKRLWQSVVKAKISNQALCLRLAGKESEAQALFSLADRVRSGDSENAEATAAQLYFPALFGEGFTRGEENGYNAALNYGYAILRGCTARTLAVYGFLPSLGIHHRSALNAFNLADDLMEPFRPLVDLLVHSFTDQEEELTPERKRALFNCLNLEMLSGGQRHSVSYAIDREIQSLRRAMEEKQPVLTLPALTELKQHSYE
jgi:CRISPR-associated protein Cas1